MNSFKMKRFFPNECFICKARNNLKRCKCNMISYCCEDHRLEHLPVHESFCKVIQKLLKENRVLHIHEELQFLNGDAWTRKKVLILNDIEQKLGRAMSPLEYLMFTHPRVCFVCRQTRQENLTNCPDCPVVSFCKIHPQDELHSMNCKVMNRYLATLNTAEELNIDFEFLSHIFPCIRDDKKIEILSELTWTFKVIGIRDICLKLSLLKMDLINFMNMASKINSALQKIHNTVPEDLIIHIDALSYEHAITEENYWEFLLHLNPQIRKLKIVITATQNKDNLETSLCQNCHSQGKNLSLEILSKSYDDYMLDENYQTPNILFYVQFHIKTISKRSNKRSEFNCPIILRFDSKKNFYKTQYFISSSTAKCRFIYKGTLNTPFGPFSVENKDYFVILQTKENRVLQKYFDTLTGEITENNVVTNATKNLSDAEDIDLEKCVESNSENDSRITLSESKNNSDSNENSQLEIDESQSASTSCIESSKIIVIEKKNTNTDETEEEKNPNKEETERRESNEESSSVRSFVFISGPKEEEEEKDLDSNGKERESEKFENFSQSNAIEHGSHLENGDESLRLQLNLALKEITKLQIKFNQLCFELNKKEKVIMNLLPVIVNFEDTDSVYEENKI